MISNISRAMCYVESHNSQCFSEYSLNGAAWWESGAHENGREVFSWGGSKYQLSCNAGQCTLFQVVPKKESTGDTLVQAFFGILTLGLASCESQPDTELQDVAWFKDGGNSPEDSTPEPKKDFFEKPLPMCLLTKLNPESLSGYDINAGQVSSCIYLNGLSDQNYQKINIETYSGLIDFLATQDKQWVYADFNGDNQLPGGMFGGNLPAYIFLGYGDIIKNGSELLVDKSSAAFKAQYVYKTIIFTYGAPCKTTSCNLP